MFKKDNVDREFRESYRKLLFNQYASLSKKDLIPEVQTEADRIIEINREDITWEDLYQLELAVIKLEPFDSLKRRIWILRNEYREVASVDEIKDYFASNPPDPKTAIESELRADAVHLQEELNWRYVVIWVFESFRGDIIKSLVGATMLLISVLLILICFWERLVNSVWLASTQINLPLLALIVVPGILGGLVSTLRRIQIARLGSNADADLSELEEGKLGIYLSPLLGGIFALLLFFIFTSGLMEGDLFPKFCFDDLLLGEPKDYGCTILAKLIVWSFIAGFAEKFVPDKLQRFTEESEKKSSGTSVQ